MPRPSTLPEPFLSLAARLGGVQRVADALLTTPRTIHRWAHGVRKPNRQAQAMIDALCVELSCGRPVYS